MSIWSVLLALQGFIYDGPSGRIGFKPIWKLEDHSSFFTAAEGWGLFEQRRQKGRQSNIIEIAFGSIRLNEIILEVLEEAIEVDVRVGMNSIDISSHQIGKEQRTVLKQGLILKAGESLVIDIKTRPASAPFKGSLSLSPWAAKGLPMSNLEIWMLSKGVFPQRI